MKETECWNERRTTSCNGRERQNMNCLHGIITKFCNKVNANPYCSFVRGMDESANAYKG
ncbi:hypothetical protein Mapa_011479 [Marchantia paleacea]|nr:hypothetical protein Mapa_011479 [Marchantia paleacea]